MIDQPLDVEATISETTKEILERRGINVRRLIEMKELQSRARMHITTTATSSTLTLSNCPLF